MTTYEVNTEYEIGRLCIDIQCPEGKSFRKKTIFLKKKKIPYQGNTLSDIFEIHQMNHMRVKYKKSVETE